MGYRLIKKQDPNNSFDFSDVEVSTEHSDLTTDDLAILFRKFMLACEFHPDLVDSVVVTDYFKPAVAEDKAIYLRYVKNCHPVIRRFKDYKSMERFVAAFEVEHGNSEDNWLESVLTGEIDVFDSSVEVIYD